MLLSELVLTDYPQPVCRYYHPKIHINYARFCQLPPELSGQSSALAMHSVGSIIDYAYNVEILGLRIENSICAKLQKLFQLMQNQNGLHH